MCSSWTLHRSNPQMHSIKTKYNDLCFISSERWLLRYVTLIRSHWITSFYRKQWKLNMVSWTCKWGKSWYLLIYRFTIYSPYYFSNIERKHFRLRKMKGKRDKRVLIIIASKAYRTKGADMTQNPSANGHKMRGRKGRFTCTTRTRLNHKY